MSEGTSAVRRPIAARLVAAQHRIQSLAKDSETVTASGPRYKYAASDDVVRDAREALTAEGLAFVRVGWSIVEWLTPLPPRKQDGDERPRCVLSVDYMLISEEGESMRFDGSTIVALADGGRPIDKAMLGALTSHMGYMLLGILQIDRQDPDEISARQDRYDGGPPEPPKARLGAAGAAELRRKVRDAGLEWSALIADIRAKNPALADTDPAEWGENMRARVINWCAAKAPARTMTEAMAMLSPKAERPSRKPERKEETDDAKS
jgi:hypothetical protein